jgi:RNA polymerase sigma factor (sigma-70 family)
MDGAVPVSVRPRESRKPSLSTASSGIVLDIPWIEAEGEEENQSPLCPIRASSRCNASEPAGVLSHDMNTALTHLTNRLAVDRDGAYPDLVKTLQDGVFSGALQLTRNRQDAEDVTQETFVRAYRALGSYGEDRIRDLQVRPWVWTIALNVCRNRARTVKRHPESALVDDHLDRTTDTAEEAAANVDLEVWRQRLAGLNGPQRTGVVLHHVVGLPHAEIAESTGRSESTVRSDVRRGLARLRTMLEEETP